MRMPLNEENMHTKNQQSNLISNRDNRIFPKVFRIDRQANKLNFRGASLLKKLTQTDENYVDTTRNNGL